MDPYSYDLLARDSSPLGSDGERPGYYKAIGIGLAVGSGVFIGTSFVLKKVGLLRANEKYDEVAGEGYGYLKNAYWWGGMTLMIFGEICNFVAYCFTDAILVTPLGALSVVITTVLSAIFLKERLSMVGKVACFLCIVGSVVIVMNAPKESSVKNIEEMQDYVITPGFLTYAGLIIVGSIATAFYAGPKWGSKNMLVYISICSWVGGLSVVATQGLGASIVAWIGGEAEYKHWFLWVLLVFVIATLLTEIIYLNKALNIFNAALVTPTYYVYFTSTTIITSAVLFQGFKGSVESIVTVVLGFLTICSGVVLLQLSKSAKDVPDAAVFTGDLDQIHTIAEQQEPETEPKADAIRGAAGLVRRFSTVRQKMEAEEFRRLHEEKRAESMEPISEDGQPQYEWDGLRRRRTVAASVSSRSRSVNSQWTGPYARSAHPPLGMSHFPSYDENDHDDHDRSTIFSSIAGTIRGRSRNHTMSPTREVDEEEDREDYQRDKVRSTTHPVPLTEISVPRHKPDDDDYYARTHEHTYPGETSASQHSHQHHHHHRHHEHEHLDDQDTAYHGAPNVSDNQSLAPIPPPHTARRQFSFNNVFRRSPGPSDEERIGLVKDDEDDQPEGKPAFV